MLPVADDVSQLVLMPRNAINAYLVGDVLVDTGIKQSAGKLAEMLRGREIAAIVLTHAHGDHAGSMKRVAAELGLPVWCGAADREAAETGNVVLSRGLDRPGVRTLARAVGRFAGVPVARVLAEGDTLSAGFTVLDTPGHSPGHISLWRETDRTLICGDVFFNMSLLSTAPGLREPPRLLTTDPVMNRESERRLADIEPRTVCFGHGPVLSEDAEHKLQQFASHLPGA